MPIGEAFPSVLEAAKAGDDRAWATLFSDLAGQVVGYLASRGAPDPENVAGETFLQIARNVRQFDGDESSFRSWVFVIAHRRLIDARRSAGRRPEVVTTLESVVATSNGEDVETEALDKLTTAGIEKAFGLLTDDQRDVLTLRIIGNLTVAETAEVVGKAQGAVKALQRRGLAALRDHIDLESVTL